MKYAMQGIYRNPDYMRNMYYFDFMNSRRKNGTIYKDAKFNLFVV